MKKIWILLVIALVILFLGFREGLEPTNEIKAPNPTGRAYSDAELDRAIALVPVGLKDDLVRSLNLASTVTEAQRTVRVRSITGPILKQFYNTIYRPATSQITNGDVDRYVDSRMTRSTPAAREYARALLKAYFVGQTPSAYQRLLAEMGQTTGPPPPPMGESTLARKRPGPGDTRLRGEVAAYTGLPTNNPMVDTIINEMARFYDSVYVPNGKRMPSQSDIQSFVMRSTVVPANRKPNLTSAIDYWFTEPAASGDFRVEGGTPTPPPPPGTMMGGPGGGGGAGAASGRGFGIANNQIWGPPFSGLGRPRNWGDGGDGSGRYPNLLGPPRQQAPYMTGVGVVPPSASSSMAGTLPPPGSTGSDPMAAFLPYSRQPGDQDRIPDPYRVSQSYSPSSNSSKNEPVPFLTDFSAFLK
jgi:hypothetical protein